MNSIFNVIFVAILILLIVDIINTKSKIVEQQKVVDELSDQIELLKEYVISH